MFMVLFLPVFSMLLPRDNFTMLSFQMKRIISSEKWRNYVLFFFFFLKMAKIWVGRTTVNGEKEVDGHMVKMY